MTTDLKDLTKKELQDRARDADVSVGGTKDDLIRRLKKADEGSASKGSSSGKGSSSSESGSPTDAMRAACKAIQQSVSAPIEAVTGVRRDSDEWVVDIQTVEARRIPPSSDVLAMYEVHVDAEGELLSFSRTRRARRDQLETS